MATEVAKSGVDAIGDMVTWGNHFCLFYETKEDLLETLVSYCKSGLEKDEYCLWVVAEPLTIGEATDALRDAVPDLERHIADSNLELASADDWFLRSGAFAGSYARRNWYEKLARAGAKGYRGVRATGDTAWLARKDWSHFCDFEDGMNEVFRALVSSWPTEDLCLAMLCTYPLARCGTPQILDVLRTHQFVLARRYGNWDVLETASLKQAKAEMKRLNEELEERVQDRTNELVLASEKLRETQAELARVNRLTTMGQLAASISHEVMQPIAAGVTNACTALRWLDAQPPDLEEARQALIRTVNEGNRASDVMAGIRALIKKTPPRKTSVDINKAIRDVITLTHGEALKNGVLLQTQLAQDLPPIQGDRVQLQQVILNLIINAIDAMRGVNGRSRTLLISTGRGGGSGSVFVTVEDSGSGLPSGNPDRLFDPFYSTKSTGMGMGLSICRSIVEDHGGRMWASHRLGPGAAFQFTLPTEVAAREAA